MKNFTIIFVHGTGGYNADWFPNIGNEMRKREISFKIPQLPNKKPIEVNDWINGLHKTILSIDKPIIFVGYSLGTRAILLYIDKYKLKVDHIFLVAAFSNDTRNALDNTEYPSFFKNKINMEVIKKNVKKITILHSEDDWSVPYNQALELSEELDAELISYKDKGHFTDASCSKDILKVLVNKLDLKELRK